MAANTAYDLILIDGSSYLFRAYHALPPLTAADGHPTGAMVGVINMLRRLLDDYAPRYVAVVFDTKGKNFRHEMYAEYKANRAEMPEDLAVQIEPIHDIIRSMGLPLLAVPGVEADDVIGTLARRAASLKLKTLISTGDKDMAQLVDEHVTLINTMTGLVQDSDGIMTKFGVPPERIIDYLALIGDTSDNVPGVKKVGPKTAVKWLTQYGTLDGVVENAGAIGGKVGENLREALAWLPTAKALVTIKEDVLLECDVTDLVSSAPDEASLVEKFQRYQIKGKFKKSAGQTKSEVPEPVIPATKNADVDYEIILCEEAFAVWLEKLKKAEHFAFDTETTSLDCLLAEIVGVSFAVTPFAAAYVPVAHDYEGAPAQLNRDVVLAALKPLLEDVNKKKLGQNLKYDRNVLANYGIKLQGIAFDTMLESYVLNSTGGRHDLDSLSLKHVGVEPIHFKDVAGSGAKQVTFNKVSLETAGPYAAEDADLVLRLHEAMWPQLEKELALVRVFETMEMPLLPVLADIERNGVLIDVDKLNAQSKQLAGRLAVLEQSAYTLAGEEFNLASPKQLQAIFFEKLNLPIIKKTPKGQPSTAEPVLQELALDYELPKVILEYRSLSKLKSTYTDRLPEQVNVKTGRVHTSYHQAVTATGRLSSSDPNLQNIPVRTEEGRKIRQAFIAPPQSKIVALDYSQIELRIMAHLSKDKGLCQAFLHGQDIHKATASEVFGVPVDAVLPEQRRRAKAINFGLIYGMSAFGLAKQLGLERSVAQEYINLYFARYPGVHDYMESTRDLAHKQGYVETLFGRRLYLPEINARNKMRQQAAERTAINAPMQGTAADIIKRAMLDVNRWLHENDSHALMIMQVHDELVFEVSAANADRLTDGVRPLMENAVELSVPLIVDVGIGDNWEEAH